MSVYETAACILSGVVDNLDGDVPDRTYVQSGTVAWDQCEQLVLSVVRIRPGSPANQSIPSVCGPSTVVAQVSRVWCVPVGTGKAPPSARDLEDSGEQITRGGEALYLAVLEAVGDSGGCKARVTGSSAIGSSGGLIGWVVDIEWAL